VTDHQQVFIDGQAGTTGLEIAQRLSDRDDVRVLQIDPAERKSPDARRRLMADADVTILCLPDDAAREAVLLASDQCRILDASSAHRISDGWVYGCPEMQPGQRQAIANAQRVSNPGCYPQGVILLVKPLIDAGLLSADKLLTVFGLSGYSGGGRQLIEKYQAFSDLESDNWNTRPYSLALQHKHVPEMHQYSGARHRPLFVPSVGNFYRGMLVQIPIFTSELKAGSNITDLHDTLNRYYQNERFIEVLPVHSATLLDDGYLNATATNNSNNMQLLAFGNDEQIVLIARYDNLVKGAAGAAIQNLNLMLGVEESTGLLP
jgi:N-acetyl-gamma-glutamyl-phosphate reductase